LREHSESVALLQRKKPGTFMQSIKEMIIDNTYMGEQIEFIQPDTEHNGRFVEYYHYMFWKGSGYLQEHVHPSHDEVFEVIKGKAVYYVNGKKYKAKAGTIIRIPKGKKHINPFNADLSELIIKKRDAVGLRTESFYRQLYHMADKGKFKYLGIPSKLQRLALTALTKGQTIFTAVPLFIQKPLIALAGKYLIKAV
jgi:mannose-6-phosphate isomerase-like protein (cupin superfamily)